MSARMAMVFVSCALTAQVASADTIRITGGSASESVSTVADFVLLGPSFRLEGEFGGGPLQTCSPCVPGTPFSLSTTYDVLGHALLNGSPVMATGTFAFTSSEVLVPALSNVEIAVFQRPFTFLGLLNIAGQSVETRLIGQGMVTLRFYEYEAGKIAPLQVDFDFTPAPVPEPATLLLVGSGVAGGILARRRRQRRENQRT